MGAAHIHNILKTPQFIVVDLFCGAGGTSLGFDRAKIKIGDVWYRVAEVIACVNHDALAIRNHSINFQNCIHFTEDVRNMNFAALKSIVKYYRRKWPTAKLILWASLECTHFSNAKTGSRNADSRTLAHVLYKYQRVLQPEFIMIENVREFMSWGPLVAKTIKAKGSVGAHCPIALDRKTGQISGMMVPENRKKGIDYLKWRQTLESKGYRYDSRLLNSADFGSHQARLRYFGVFAKHGLPIVFPTPTHDKKSRNGLPKWKAVREVLDLDDFGRSIFDRKIPLSPNTEERILAGLLKFVANGDQAYLVKHYSGNPDDKVVSLDSAAPTITCRPHESLISTDFICQYNGRPEVSNFATDRPCNTVTTHDRYCLIRAANWIDNRTISGRPTSVDGPAPTLVTNPTQSVVSVFIDHANRNGEPTPVDRPANTVVTDPRQSVVSAVFIDNQFGHEGDARGATSLDDPSGTLMTVPKKNLVSAAFIDRQFGNSKGASIEEPCGALPTEPKTNLVSAEFIMPTNYNNEPTSLDEPLTTLTANRKWHYVISTQPWIMTNIHSNSGTSVDQPSPTLLTGTHHYLLNPQFDSAGSSIMEPCFTLIAKMDKRPPSIVTVVPEENAEPIAYLIDPAFFKDKSVAPGIRIRVFMDVYGIKDIYMRMLNIPELKRIQGLNIRHKVKDVWEEIDYHLFGPKDQQKKFIGNAVVPHVVTEWIVGYCRELLGMNEPEQLTLF